MKYSTIFSLAAALYPASTIADHAGDGDHAQKPVANCRNNICYSMAVPEATIESEEGPVYFQIYAPDTFTWVGVGTGTGMANANIFVMYQDGNGNVTVSPRQATGHTMPTVPSSGGADIELLGGSGVSDGWMVANFRCDNCESWKQTQELNFTSETPMIGAWREGDPLDSDDIEADIQVHTGNVRSFAFDLSQAQVNSPEGNPFTGDHAVPEGANGTDSGSDDEDDENAAAGRKSFLFGSVVIAAVVAGLNLLL